MMRQLDRAWLLLLLLPLTAMASPVTPPTTQPDSAIHWVAWSDKALADAKAQHKFVLLDLHAVWCHWCHVMDDTTYADPAVQKLIAERYIAVGVDADARPDLANRYEDYGWPATIVFDGDGKEIVKRRGYLTPGTMAGLLQAIVDDPTPGPSVHAEVAVTPAASATLSKATREQLTKEIKADYDEKNAGWGGGQKFLDVDVIDFCLTSGDATLVKMAADTLAANRKLIDPAWGGVYQYSTDGDWDHPHFEKIMSFQADNIRAYSHAYAITHQASDLADASAICSYLKIFLTSPDGAFYTSQDADLIDGQHAGEYFALDDAGRRKLGVPRIDEHIYARENGWAITGLIASGSATARIDPNGATTRATAVSGTTSTDSSEAIADAVRAAEWVVAHRSLPGGGFSHDEHDAAGPYLGDTLAMGRACLALYSATADRAWLDRADSAAGFIAATFAAPGGAGFLTAANESHARPQFDENVQLARFANLLFAYTGNKADRATAEAAMKYVASPQVIATRHWLVGGILLADQELASEPLHVAIVGAKNDSAAKELFDASLPTGTGYVRREWIDPAAPPLRRQDVEYPKLPRAAAFLCSNGACSRPVFDAAALRKLMAGN